jgi:hypothetical protein
MEYKLLLSPDDMVRRGYDLKVEGRLNQGDFNSIEDAIDDFMQQCFDSIYNLIEMYRGPSWTSDFFDDMSTAIIKDNYPLAYKLQEALKWALLEQTVFIYDNGDINTSSKIEIDKIGYSPKSIQKLWSYGILR